MKTALMLIAAILASGAGHGEYDASEKETIQKTLQFPAGGTVHEIVVDNIAGRINVAGYDGSDIQLTAHRTSYGNTDAKLKEAKEKIHLDIKEEPGRIILFVDAPWRCGDGISRNFSYGYDATFDFDLKVPRKTNFYLKTVNEGEVTVRDLNGAFEVSNVNGGITMSGISGAGMATTVNGKIEVQFNKNPESRCGFKTVNGSIDVEFPDELAADLKLKTFNGEVYSDFDVTGMPGQAAAPEKVGRRTIYRNDDFSSVRAGRGGPPMVFETLNGDVRILRTHNSSH